MGSVLAVLDAKALKPHAKSVVVGAVLPIDRYLTEETSFATHLSLGGAIYLVAAGSQGEVLLLAVIETPECARVKVGDKRPLGWYGPVNTTPVTDISKLRRKLKLGKKLELDEPLELTPAMDDALREQLDDVAAPLLAEVGAAAAAAPEVSGPPLSRAATLLAGGHLVAAIEAIKDAWRASRDPVIADLVDRVTRLTPEYHRPLYDKREHSKWITKARGLGTDTKIWHAALAADPATYMPQLLLNFQGSEDGAIPKRTAKLAELPEDPRIGARLLELFHAAPNWETDSWWGPLIELWIRSRDLRVFEDIDRMGIEFDATGPKATKLRAIARAPKLAIPQPTPDELDARAAIARELDRLEEPLRTECALVDEIAANPGDDGPYLVYADWLIERGRPLGELIMLACQQNHAALSSAQARRYQALLDVPYLCGPFDDLPTSRLRKRERGIDRALSAYWSTTPRSWRVVAASPLLRAIENIELVGNEREGREDALAEVIEAAPRLKRIDNLGKGVATRLAQRTKRQAAVSGSDLVFDVGVATRGGRRR